MVGQQDGHPSCKKLDVGLLLVISFGFARVIAPVVTTTSVILAQKKIQKLALVYLV